MEKKYLFGYLVAMVVVAAVASGCNMFRSWQSIPPPGGCDECHTVNIAYDWKLAYQAPHLTDERNRDYFQRPESVMPTSSKPNSALDIRKVEDLKCFDCHRSPDAKHTGRVGHYHH